MQDTLPRRFRLGVFVVDLRAGEIRDGERSVVLHHQPLEILRMLIEREGQIVTRDEIQKKLWPNDTVVEFDHSINAAVNKLRQGLGDSAVKPRYIETVARRGYRLLVSAEPIPVDSDKALNGSDSGSDTAPAESRPAPKWTQGANLIGRKVSHYRVANVIGVGGMGLVYEAEDLKLGRAVALKFLPEDLVDDPAALQRFEREARAASSLDHPNICTIYEVEEHEGQPFIVMQLLRGETLRDRLAALQAAQQSFALPDLIDIATQISEGLAAAHAKGIVHRDIKPANVFLTTSGQVKILDFGLAKLIEAEEAREEAMSAAASAGSSQPANRDLTITGLTMGTAGYMSPEQARGEKLDARTDLFSFGLVLYEMAAGHRAFTGETAAAVKDAIQNNDPVPLRERNPGLPARLEEVISRALEKDRERRYQSAVEMRAGLAGCQVTAGWQSVLRKKWSIFSLVAVTLAIIATAVYRPTVRQAGLRPGDTLVIAQMVSGGGETTLGEALMQPLRTEFDQSPFLGVLATEKIRDALRTLNKPYSTELTPDLAQQVCLRTNSQAVVQSSITDQGNHYRLELKATRCDSKGEIARSEVDVKTRNDIVRSLGTAGSQLRIRMGESKKSVEQFSKPLDQATSASLEALEVMAEAMRLRYDAGNSVKVLPLYEKVQALDPAYALVYKELGMMYINAGQRQRSTESLTTAFGMVERLTTRDRCAIEPLYYHVALGDVRKAVEVSSACIDTYPWDAAAHDYLAAAFRVLGQPERAALEAREALRIGFSFDRVYNLMLASLAMNRLDQAKEAFEQVDRDKLQAPELSAARYLVAFCEGDVASMHRQIEATIAMVGHEPPIMLAKERDTAAFHGQLRRARSLSLRATDIARSDGDAETSSALAAEQALQEVEVGNIRYAKQMLDHIDPSASWSYVRALRVLVLVRAVDEAAGEDLARAVKESAPRDLTIQEIWLPSILAALRSGHPGSEIEPSKSIARTDLEGVDMWEPFGFMYPAYMRGLVYLQQANGPRAANEFETILQHHGLVANFIIGALAHLQLARAQVMMDDKEAARKSYQEFLTLWKDADPDIPIYQQAKAEYAKLK
jgi:serine/threonine protein kinase/tetratricopeptide (TPR) repeat protein